MGKSISSTGGDPLVLGPEDFQDVPRATKKAAKTAPRDPLVLGPEDFPDVKKKVGGEPVGTGSAPTPSGSGSGSGSADDQGDPLAINKASKAYQDKTLTVPDLDVLAKTDWGKQQGFNMPAEAKKAFVQAYNGPQTSELVNSVNGVLNASYPKAAPGSEENRKREQIFQGVLKGDVPTILKVKEGIADGNRQKIAQIKANPQGEEHYTAEGQGIHTRSRDLSREQIRQIAILEDQSAKAVASLDAYTAHAIVNSPAIQSQLKTELTEKNSKYADLTLSANDAGTMLEKAIGIKKTIPNNEYERTRAGLEAIITSTNMDINDLMTKGIKSKDPGLIKQAEEKIRQLTILQSRHNNLDNQYPDVGTYKTARYLGDILSETNPNRLLTTAGDVKKAAAIAEQRNPGFLQSHGKFVDAVAKSEGDWIGIKEGMVPQGGVIGGIKAGIMEEGWKGAAFVASPFGKTWDPKTLKNVEGNLAEPQLHGTSKSGEQSTKIVYDKEGKMYREDRNENYGSWDFNSAMYSLGKGIPALAKWVVLEKGLGALAKGTATAGAAGLNIAGKVAAAGTDALIGGSEATAGLKGVEVAKGLEHTGGLFGATYVTSYDDNRKIAESWIDDKTDLGEAKKNALAHILTLSTAGVFSILNYTPTKALENTLTRAVAPDAFKLLEKAEWKDFTETGLTQLMRENIYPRVKAMISAAGKNALEGAKLGGVTVLDQKIKDFAGMMVSPDKAKVSSPEENLHSVVEQVLLMTVVGLPGMAKSGMFPHTAKDALYNAGLLAPQFVDQITERAARGDITQDQANKMISMVKVMGEETAKARFETDDDGKPITLRARKELAINNFRKRAAEELEKKGVDMGAEGVASESDKNSAELKKENAWLPLEKAPPFLTAREEETGKRPPTPSDIDPEKIYTYEKDGKTVATTGAELSNHLINGDYEQQSENAQTAEGKDQQRVQAEQRNQDAEGQNKDGQKDVSPELLEKGKAAIAQALSENKIKGVYATAAADHPEAFLKEVADQAQGRTATGQKADNLGAAEKNAREAYTDEVVDAALALHPQEKPKTPETVVIRHGESTGNARKVRSDDLTELTKKGEEQATEKGKELKAQGYTDVLPSATTRAQQTAEKVVEQTGGKILEKPELSQALKEWDQVKEPIEDFAQRIAGAREEIAKLPEGTAVIAHGKVMGMLEALDKTDGDVKKAIEEFDKTKVYGNTDTYIPSRKTENNEKGKTGEDKTGNQKNSQGGQEGGGKPAADGNADRQEAAQRGDVLNESGAGGEDTPAPNRAEVGSGETPPPGEGEEPLRKTVDKPVGITHRANELRRLQMNMKRYERVAQTFEQWNRAAGALLKDGYNVDKLVEDIEKTGRPTTPIENAILKRYIATVDAKIEKQPTKELVARRKKFVLAKDLSNSAAGRQLVSLKSSEKPEDNLASFLQEKMDANSVNELSFNQIKEVQKKYEELKKTSDGYKKEVDRLKKEQTNQKAQDVVDKLKKAGSKKTKKTHDDYVKERKDIIAEMKAALLKAAKGGGGLTASVPGAAQLKAIAPFVGKLLVSLADELAEKGKVKLEDVLHKLHEEIKDLVPGITKNDIRDIMAGEYAERKSTKNELTENLYNLKREAKLLSQIEKARKGEEEPAGRKGFEKNRRIIELEEKLAEVRRVSKQKAEMEDVEEQGGKLEKTYAEKLADRQRKIKNEIADIESKIAKKIYSDKAEPAAPLKLDKKTRDLQNKLIELKVHWASELARDEYAKMSKGAKAADRFFQVVGLKRLIQTAIDFSMPLRQAVVTTMNPWKARTTGEAFKNMFLHTFQPKEFARFMFNLEESGLLQQMHDDHMNLSQPDELKMDKRDEDFRTSLLDRLRLSKSKVATPFKWLLEPVFASERAAASYMNTIRINEYVKRSADLEKVGVTRDNHPEVYKDMAKWIMNSTGRGNMLKFLEDSKAGKEIAGSTFYGARLMASRFNMLNPMYYTKMPKEVRVRAMKDIAGFTSGVVLSGLALSLAGGKISMNPNDPDFMQVRFGDKVYDLTGGMVQYVRTFLRLVTLIKEKSTPGEDPDDINKYAGFVGRSTTKFFTNKLAPNTAYGYHYLTGKGGDGKDFRPGEILEYYPMYVDDMTKGWKEDGPISLLTILAPNLFGMGVQQYEKK